METIVNISTVLIAVLGLVVSVYQLWSAKSFEQKRTIRLMVEKIETAWCLELDAKRDRDFRALKILYGERDVLKAAEIVSILLWPDNEVDRNNMVEKVKTTISRRE